MFELLNPLKETDRLFRDFDRLMSDFLVCNFEPGVHSGWLPSVRIEDSEDGHTLNVDLPGVSPEDVEISLKGRQLTLKGSRVFGKEGEKGCFSRAFTRSFSLPVTADLEGIQANAENGVLTIKIPRKEEAKPRQIAISVSEPKKLS